MNGRARAHQMESAASTFSASSGSAKRAMRSSRKYLHSSCEPCRSAADGVPETRTSATAIFWYRRTCSPFSTDSSRNGGTRRLKCRRDRATPHMQTAPMNSSTGSMLYRSGNSSARARDFRSCKK